MAADAHEEVGLPRALPIPTDGEPVNFMGFWESYLLPQVPAAPAPAGCGLSGSRGESLPLTVFPGALFRNELSLAL